MRIAPVTEDELDLVLPSIAAYQRFYEVEEIDEGRNREFFGRFLEPSDLGLLIAAWADEGDGADAEGPLGHACMYWFHSSTKAVDAVLMNDLFVSEGARGQGVGRALIDACLEVTRSRGAAHLEWMTAPDNHTAQRVYDATGAERSTWLSYELDA